MIDNNLPSRPSGFNKRFRLYIDESGDHVYNQTDEIPHRYLCLLGCWFQNPAYLLFHESLEKLKKDYFHYHPDNPIIFHREEIINKRGIFKILQDIAVCDQFDADLLRVIGNADFKLVAVVIDKASLISLYGESASHPYHLGLGFLLQRYAGYLNHINRTGDLMAEARGRKEDQLLRESFIHIYEHGVWGVTSSDYFQSALSSREIKFRTKKANISGLQLADLIGHPAKMWVLKQKGHIQGDLAPFAQRLMSIIENKFNHHLYNNRIEGYGYVLYPKK